MFNMDEVEDKEDFHDAIRNTCNIWLGKNRWSMKSYEASQVRRIARAARGGGRFRRPSSSQIEAA